MTKRSDGLVGRISQGPIKEFILRLDAIFTWLWTDTVRRKDVFIHGDFTYWGFIKDNVHLFLVLGLFGALTGYLNIFIEREIPYNVYAGKLGIDQVPISMLKAVVNGQNPLNTPFPPADLIFGITTAMVMFVLIAVAILWAAINYREKEVKPATSSEFHLLMRISFVTLFGSLMLVFLSYLIRSYGLLFMTLLEIFSSFFAIYTISFIFKRLKNPWPWLVVFILPGAIIYFCKIYIPVLSVFSLALGSLSFALAILIVPFLTAKRLITHLKEKHLG